jgi:hypothetical protein
MAVWAALRLLICPDYHCFSANLKVNVKLRYGKVLLIWNNKIRGGVSHSCIIPQIKRFQTLFPRKNTAKHYNFLYMLAWIYY